VSRESTNPAGKLAWKTIVQLLAKMVTNQAERNWQKVIADDSARSAVTEAGGVINERRRHKRKAKILTRESSKIHMERILVMKKSCAICSLLLSWTIWTRTQTATSDTWAPAPGFPSQEKCQASVKEKLDTWRQFKDATFDSNSVTFTSNNSTMTYLCLPENEDPRKAKPAKPAKPQK
jgi:hypothetical protein